MMNGYRESDSFIVSEKPLNKIGDNKPVAGRRLRKGDWLRGVHLSETGARHRTGYFCKMSWRGYGTR